MAWGAERLNIALVIASALEQRDDVIALSRGGYSARCLAFSAQRLAFEQFSTELLQASTSDPARRIVSFAPGHIGGPALYATKSACMGCERFKGRRRGNGPRFGRPFKMLR